LKFKATFESRLSYVSFKRVVPLAGAFTIWIAWVQPVPPHQVRRFDDPGRLDLGPGALALPDGVVAEAELPQLVAQLAAQRRLLLRAQLQRRKLKLLAKFVSGSSYFSFKRSVPGRFKLSFIGSTGTVSPSQSSSGTNIHSSLACSSPFMNARRFSHYLRPCRIARLATSPNAIRNIVFPVNRRATASTWPAISARPCHSRVKFSVPMAMTFLGAGAGSPGGWAGSTRVVAAQVEVESKS